MAMNSNSRNIKIYYPEVDTLKGIAILFIIFSHSFCEFPVDIRGHLPLLQFFSVSFALGLFFICSGFLFRDDMSWSQFVKKKGLRIVVPMLVFGYVNVFLRLAFTSFTRTKVGGGYFVISINRPIILVPLLFVSYYGFR